MGLTRRRALGAAVGLAALAGCGSTSDPDTSAAEPTDGPITVDPPSDAPADGSDAGGTPAAVPRDHPADVYVTERGDRFSAVDRAGTVVSRSPDLGRVVRDAQDALDGGYVLVAADGTSGAAIGLGDGVTLGGVERRTAVTPAVGSDGSFDLIDATDGPDGARLESVRLDMRNRGRAAVSASGYADLGLADLRIRNTAGDGIALSGGRAGDVRECRFAGVGGAAVRIADSSDVAVTDCESTGSKYGVYGQGASDVVVRGHSARETRFNAVAMYDYTENWRVIGCRAVDSGHTPFAASPALYGSFVGCVARGTTADGEGGFEIEYKAGHDAENREAPVEGCSVVSCTAVDCDTGFYAREDVSGYDTDTSVVRPSFVDCTAVDCETGLFLGDTVVEATVRGFDAVDCSTDVVDEGTRTVIDGRSENAGDPADGGQWNGHAATAAELGVTVEDTENDRLYGATETGTWHRLD